MSKKSFDPKNCIGPLNTVKEGMQMTGLPFTKESILNSLKGCGLPINSNFWSAFRNSGILQEVSKGKFMFASKEPIYIGVLNSIKEKYKELSHRYKKAGLTVEEKKEEVKPSETDSQIKAAINLLKSQGYQIFIPVVYQKL